MMKYDVTVAPATEPVTLAEAKTHLRVTASDTANDNSITDMIVVARQAYERKIGRAFITQTIRAVVSLEDFLEGAISGPIGHSYSYAIELPLSPIQSVTSVEIETQIDQWSALVVTDDYLIDTSATPPKVFLSANALAKWSVALDYPGQKPRVRVVYVAGTGDASTVDSHFKLTIKNIVSWLYDHRGESQIPDEIFSDYRRVWTI